MCFLVYPPAGRCIPWLGTVFHLILAGCVGITHDPGLGESGPGHRDRPFEHIWLDRNADLDAYRTLSIAPVNIRYLLEHPWYSALQLDYADAAYAKEVQEVAFYAYRLLEKSFRDDPRRRFRLVKQAQPDTLLLELALVELIPSRAAARAAGLIAPRVGLLDRPSIAFEARLRDARTGATLAAFADRHTLLTRAAAGGVYGANEEVLKEWARQWVTLLNSDLAGYRAAARPFRLLSG